MSRGTVEEDTGSGAELPVRNQRDQGRGAILSSGQQFISSLEGKVYSDAVANDRMRVHGSRDLGSEILIDLVARTESL